MKLDELCNRGTNFKMQFHQEISTTFKVQTRYVWVIFTNAV